MKELQIGIIGLDTSHVVSLLAHFNNDSDPCHVKGFRIAKAYPGGSPGFSLSINRVDGYTEQLRNGGVEIVDNISAMSDMDAFLLTSVDGNQHPEQFTLLADYGKPVYIDKPLACSYSDAAAIVKLAKGKNVPLMSCSSLRYAAGISDLVRQDDGEVYACQISAPMNILNDYRDYFWYGIHSAEILFTILGRGCRSVKVNSGSEGDLITGIWGNGKFGTVFGNHFDNWEFSCSVSCRNANRSSVAIPPYDVPLKKKIAEFFRTGKSPVDIEETLEIIAFLEAASRSRKAGGAETELCLMG